MLTHLSIQNIVLISKAEIPFAAGLCVLTGETGAGKSILLDSLGLALGARAESRLVRSGEKQAGVTACFDVGAAITTKAKLQELEIEADDELIIRRTLSAEGKSKCFINDQPVSVSALKQVGETLIEIHGQHEQRGLMDTKNHIDMLDAYGVLAKPREKVADLYSKWQAAQRRLAELKEEIIEAEREQEYLSHLVDELSKLNAQQGEADALADSRTHMMQGEKLAGTLQDALSGLQQEANISEVQRMLMRSNQAGSERFDPVVDALERALVEAQEAQSLLEALLDECAYDPQKLEQTEERLFAIKAAARKYNCTEDELEQICADASGKLKTLGSQQHEISQLEAEVKQSRADYLSAAEKLSEQRVTAGGRLSKALMKELVPLKMGSCHFQVTQTRLDDYAWSSRGIDQVRFEAATNVGQAVGAIHQIASGGELSRFMLALKVVLSSVKSTPSLIFDEIDTGTGGAVADAIGVRLAMLAQSAQVLVVTHLPQVAARGNHHLFISKSSDKSNTQTGVVVLDIGQRKEELARMLAGAEVTDEARNAADKLLEVAS